MVVFGRFKGKGRGLFIVALGGLGNFLRPLKHQGKVLGPMELFPYKKGGGVDIAILRVKIGLNFGTCQAEFVRDG
ncbi:MAG: hypothetical protein A2157_01130 [Deltaproteobacteria bacterium RBG_16_47_11]|nr:MAG: hypothetical protein A2157_01130 [Deltaproteobacteria bacterium RBG_16_47_11]